MNKGDLVTFTDNALKQFPKHQRFGRITMQPQPGSQTLMVGKTRWHKSHWRLATRQDCLSATAVDMQKKIDHLEAELRYAKKAHSMICCMTYDAMLKKS